MARTVRRRPEEPASVRAGRRRVVVSRARKALFPDDGITKLDLAEYYAAVGPVMLPHVRGRPVAMERYPDGLGGERFFQKEVAGSVPGWVGTATVRKERGKLTQIVCHDVATLVYLADQACITPHAWLSRVDRPDKPDQMMFDLDPPAERFAEARRAALALRTLLAELKLPSVAKTSGGRGIHVIVPLDRRSGFDGVRGFARSVADVLSARDPDRLTTEQRKDKRRGRLFVDVSRNAYAQHAAAPYAVRARAGAPVATPLHWDEVEDVKLRSERFSMRSVRSRVDRDGDPWGGLRGRSLREPGRILRDVASEVAA